MMKVAFLLQRRSYYRLLGPVVERVLARGWDTECWEAGAEALNGRRALEQRAAGPAFRQGRPRLREYAGAADVNRRALAHARRRLAAHSRVQPRPIAGSGGGAGGDAAVEATMRRGGRRRSGVGADKIVVLKQGVQSPTTSRGSIDAGPRAGAVRGRASCSSGVAEAGRATRKPS
jgi:hypothetical protein